MLFHAGRDPLPRRDADRPAWRWLLLTAAAVGAIASMQPWIRVRFISLFGEFFGPPAWQSSAGFTCLCTSALVAVMTLAETQTSTSRQAVRPASVLLVVLMTAAILLHGWHGPGSLRGVTATWTVSFYAGLAAAAALVAASAARLTAIRARTRRPGAFDIQP